MIDGLGAGVTAESGNERLVARGLDVAHHGHEGARPVYPIVRGPVRGGDWRQPRKPQTPRGAVGQKPDPAHLRKAEWAHWTSVRVQDPHENTAGAPPGLERAQNLLEPPNGTRALPATELRLRLHQLLQLEHGHVVRVPEHAFQSVRRQHLRGVTELQLELSGGSMRAEHSTEANGRSVDSQLLHRS
eukprot:3556563-Prymnesium_polylepis.1